MTLTTRLLHLKQDWVGLLNSQKSYELGELEKTKKGVTRKLVAFEMQERAVPRHDYEIVDGTGAVIGIVTSGTMSPSTKELIGLCYSR
jgi:aminomethyltransferase